MSLGKFKNRFVRIIIIALIFMIVSSVSSVFASSDIEIYDYDYKYRFSIPTKYQYSITNLLNGTVNVQLDANTYFSMSAGYYYDNLSDEVKASISEEEFNLFSFKIDGLSEDNNKEYITEFFEHYLNSIPRKKRIDKVAKVELNNSSYWKCNFITYEEYYDDEGEKQEEILGEGYMLMSILNGTEYVVIANSTDGKITKDSDLVKILNSLHLGTKIEPVVYWLWGGLGVLILVILIIIVIRLRPFDIEISQNEDKFKTIVATNNSNIDDDTAPTNPIPTLRDFRTAEDNEKQRTRTLYDVDDSIENAVKQDCDMSEQIHTNEYVKSKLSLLLEQFSSNSQQKQKKKIHEEDVGEVFSVINEGTFENSEIFDLKEHTNVSDDDVIIADFSLADNADKLSLLFFDKEKNDVALDEVHSQTDDEEFKTSERDEVDDESLDIETTPQVDDESLDIEITSDEEAKQPYGLNEDDLLMPSEEEGNEYNTDHSDVIITGLDDCENQIPDIE